MDDEQIIRTARTSVMWGEDPETALRMLRANGLDEEEAQLVMYDLKQERDSVVRGIGVREMLVGGFLVAIPLGWWIWFYFFGGALIMGPFGIAVAGGLFRSWKLFDGVIKFFSPSTVKNSVADLEG